MSDQSKRTVWICPCGGELATRAELLSTGDEMDAYLAGYLDDDSGYCAEEDDVVPFAWGCKRVEAVG